MTTESLGPRDVQTTLNYFTPLDDQPPYRYFLPPPGVQITNVGGEPHSVVIHDARSNSDPFSLDVTGFQFVLHPTTEKDFSDEERIKTVYYAECEEILKKCTGAKRVFIFNHIIRRNVTEQTAVVRKPGLFVHVDQTFTAVPGIVKRHLGDQAESLLRGRHQIINVWRPVSNPVAHTPLALSDYRFVDTENDLVHTRIITPSDLETSLFNVKYNPKHRWYYLSDQTPDEVVLIKCFDSDISKARLSPHTAFCDDTSPADSPQRESIEVRALVFDLE